MMAKILEREDAAPPVQAEQEEQPQQDQLFVRREQRRQLRGISTT